MVALLFILFVSGISRFIVLYLSIVYKSVQPSAATSAATTKTIAKTVAASSTIAESTSDARGVRTGGSYASDDGTSLRTNTNSTISAAVRDSASTSGGQEAFDANGSKER